MHISGRIRSSRDSRLGFTLIELLVVIAIIAVLAAIMLPSLSAARQEARALQCENNIRQLAGALFIYASEYKGKFPPNIVASGPAKVWSDEARIGSYVRLPPASELPQASVYVCPEDEQSRRSYSMNFWASSKVDPVLLASPPQGELWATNTKRASELVLLVESWSYVGSATAGYSAQPAVGAREEPGKRFGGGGGLPPFFAGRWDMLNCELTFARHRRRNGLGSGTQPRGRIVIAFGDGHVEFVSSDALVNFSTGELTGKCSWSPLDRCP